LNAACECAHRFELLGWRCIRVQAHHSNRGGGQRARWIGDFLSHVKMIVAIIEKELAVIAPRLERFGEFAAMALELDLFPAAIGHDHRRHTVR